jgi:hypothetical protein
VLVFNKSTAAPRDFVTVRTAGRMAVARHPVRVFLAAEHAAATIRSARDARLIPLGKLTRARRGFGRLTFRVPNVPPGDYAGFVSTGRRLARSGSFRVAEAKPELRTCASAVYGELAAGWETDAAYAGSIGFVGGRPGSIRLEIPFGKPC